MGVKGLWWWWGSDFISTGLTACDPTTNSNVWPSGAARATVLEPITPLAPVRLATTTDWPPSSDRRCAIRRPTMAVPPPAAYATTSVTALLGYLAPGAKARPPVPTAASDARPASIWRRLG